MAYLYQIRKFPSLLHAWIFFSIVVNDSDHNGGHINSAFFMSRAARLYGDAVLT